MFSSGSSVTRQLFPLVSMKSCLVMAVGSMWCSRNGWMKAFPTMGRSTEPTYQHPNVPGRTGSQQQEPLQ
ncbi:mCG1042830 [Mus musculus]|nr:mCG1042830 [Mus musculus]